MRKKKAKERKKKDKVYRLDELGASMTIGLNVGTDKQGRSVKQAFRELHCGQSRCELYANSCTACLRAIVNDPALKAEHLQATKEYSAKKSGLVLPDGATNKKRLVRP
jgi:hypothetical protein